MKARYALDIPPLIRRQIHGLRASARDAIRVRLQEIVEAAGANITGEAHVLGPPLRFYVGAFRILYRVEPATLRVTVLELRAAFA